MEVCKIAAVVDVRYDVAVQQYSSHTSVQTVWLVTPATDWKVHDDRHTAIAWQTDRRSRLL